jgi:hypothetical protein
VCFAGARRFAGFTAFIVLAEAAFTVFFFAAGFFALALGADFFIGFTAAGIAATGAGGGAITFATSFFAAGFFVTRFLFRFAEALVSIIEAAPAALCDVMQTDARA